MQYLKKVSIAMCILFVLSDLALVEAVHISTNDTMIEAFDAVSIEFNVDSPNPLDYEAYEFTTYQIGEIMYLIHYINALPLVDDGEDRLATDTCNIHIQIKYNNGQARSLMITELCRLFDYVSKRQYQIDPIACYKLLDLVQSIKAGAFTVSDDALFVISEWATDEVEMAIQADLVPKVNQVAYQKQITRKEVCELICSLLKQHGYTEKLQPESPFKDTLDSSIIMLQELRVVQGKTRDMFYPYDFITRQELAKLLSNTYRLLQGEVPPATGELPYADQDRIGGWAVESVSDMLSLGILRGNDQNEFQPERMVTKEEVILSLLRLHEAVSA